MDALEFLVIAALAASSWVFAMAAIWTPKARHQLAVEWQQSRIAVLFGVGTIGGWLIFVTGLAIPPLWRWPLPGTPVPLGLAAFIAGAASALGLAYTVDYSRRRSKPPPSGASGGAG